MVQGGCSLCLTFESAQRLRILRETVRKELQGNEAAELGVFSFVHDAHPTAAQLLKMR